MENITRIVNTGACTGCNACNFCEHISFKQNKYGFFSPEADENCTGCGKCVDACIYDPYREEDEDESNC